jgi:hypothetical protein
MFFTPQNANELCFFHYTPEKQECKGIMTQTCALPLWEKPQNERENHTIHFQTA